MTVIEQATAYGREAAQLEATFDPEQLLADLHRLQATRWQPQRSIGDAGFIDHPTTGWRCLALRSPAGDGDRTDAGGAGLDEFDDTPWLNETAYLRQVLASIPAPLRGTRLMRLEPGAHVDEHQDGKCGLAYGTARLHVPITTNAGAVLTIDGHEHRWQPGALWYADFRRPHSVRNEGSTTRTHLVIDTYVTRDLLRLFPSGFRQQQPLGEVLMMTTSNPTSAAEIDSYACKFALPERFLDWAEEDEDHTDDSPQTYAIIAEYSHQLALYVHGAPTFGLVHLGNGKFRLAGWTEERTLTIETTLPHPQVRITTRYGNTLTETTVPAIRGATDH